jgi:hypothetical protein
MPVYGPLLNVSHAAVRNATTSGSSLVVTASALVSLADWVFASSMPVVGVVVDVELDTTAGGTRYGPSPKTSCVVQPGNVPCVAVYSTGYGPAKCALPDVAATAEVFTIACSFSLPSYSASTLGVTPIVFNASCPKCGAPVSGNTTFSHSADSSAVTGAPDGGAVSSRGRVASSGTAFTASCDGDAAAAIAVFPITVIICAAAVIVRGVWFAVVLRRSSSEQRSSDNVSSAGSSGDRSGTLGTAGKGGHSGFWFGLRRVTSASAAVVQAPTVSVRHGLVPLHAWAGLVLPFHSHTAVQQVAIFATQIVAAGAITAGVMEAAGVNDGGAGALGTSPFTLTVIVAIGAPFVAAVAVRTPLHLLLMWHRIRDRRRYYVKSFDAPSERDAARTQAAALWTPRAAPRRPLDATSGCNEIGSFTVAGFPASMPAPEADGLLHAPHSDGSAGGSAAPAPSAPAADASCGTATEGSDSQRHAQWRMQRRAAMLAAVPTHATHVRVSAYRSTAAAMGLALVLFVAAAVGGVLATRDWCAAAQARYNTAFAAVLGVDFLVVSPLWVALLYLYRWVMAEPRVVAHSPRGARGSVGSENASASSRMAPAAAWQHQQQQQPGEIKAVVEHEPYPIHNAWRRA